MKIITFAVALTLAAIGGTVAFAARDAMPAKNTTAVDGTGNVGGWWPLTSQLPTRH